MPRKIAAGTLLWRLVDQELEVLIVHPSGNYNKKAPWSIAKGEVDAGEDLEATARRETREETGIEAGELRSLGFIDYVKSPKRVHAFAGPAPEGAAPRCASWEVDRAEFLPALEAREKLHPDQRVFVDRLIAALTT
jgi:predicted NUDIX family NTP pyrophosphohydrolase